MDWWFFSFLRWTIVPTARLTPTLVAQSGCFHPWIINIFHWSLIVLSSQPLLPVFPQETWFSYLHILNLLQISSFCQPSLDLLALYREREGEWNSLLEVLGRTENYTLSVSIQHSDKLMTFNQDNFFWCGGIFYFAVDGEVWVLPLCSGCFWSHEGWKHWHIPPGKGLK